MKTSTGKTATPDNIGVPLLTQLLRSRYKETWRPERLPPEYSSIGFPANLYELRQRTGLSISDFCKLLGDGYYPSTLKSLEGKTRPKVRPEFCIQLSKIAKSYGLPNLAEWFETHSYVQAYNPHNKVRKDPKDDYPVRA